MQQDMPFVGRKAQMQHFKQLLNACVGACWLVQGGPGIGKSRLLAQCRDRLDRVHHPFLFLDRTNHLQAEGERLLRALCRGSRHGSPPAPPVGDEMSLVLAELEGLEDGLPHALEYVAGADAPQLVGIIQALLAVLFDAGRSRPESFGQPCDAVPRATNALENLKAEGRRHPVLFIDSPGHLTPGGAGGGESILDGEHPSHATLPELDAAACLLSSLLRLFARRGWIVVLSGRRLGDFIQLGSLVTLNRLLERDIAELFAPLLALFPCSRDERIALVRRVWQAGFCGNPLWVGAVLHWVKQRFMAGDSPNTILQSWMLSRRLESIPVALYREHDDRRKMEIVQKIAAGWRLPLQRLWLLALPWRIDPVRIRALFDQDEAAAALQLLWQAGLCSAGAAGSWQLSEEFREVLFWWAGTQGLRHTQEECAFHRRLLAALVAEHRDWADISWLDKVENTQQKDEERRRGLTTAAAASWLYEATWHAIHGSEIFLSHGSTADDFAACVLAAPNMSPFDKWLVGSKLEGMGPRQLAEMSGDYSKAFVHWCHFFGHDCAQDLREAARRGETSAAGDTDWWRRRVHELGDPGAFLGLFVSLTPQTMPDLNICTEDLRRWGRQLRKRYGDDASPTGGTLVDQEKSGKDFSLSIIAKRQRLEDVRRDWQMQKEQFQDESPPPTKEI